MEPAARALHRALITRKNTSTGATPFRAFTNRLPSRMKNWLKPSITALPDSTGTVSARMTPMTRPTRMRLMRLTSLYFLRTSFAAIADSSPSTYI